jgi:hypothetical protein
MEANEMLLQFVQEHQRMICALCRNDLLVIESFLSGPGTQEALVAAAATVRATLYSLDALGDKILALDVQSQHH